MIYLIALLFIILFVTTISLHNIQNKKFLNLKGIPLSLKFPLNLNLTETKNYVLCLSTECARCNQIVDEIIHLGYPTTNVYIAFIENENTIDEYIKNKDTLNFDIIKNMTKENLYIENTPFMYVLNEEGRIIDKGILKDTKYLEIY
ncbi:MULTISPECIES: hypothetical protein [Bacillati]|uniref:Uncharacterized protein n=2 Tax=Bacteria TaxID=2 RepID=A0A8B2ZMM1_STAWA|nr:MULTISPECIES: hypothetical protein [Staphylococcus]MBL3399568.1 hypothetical protein [Staphylococcus pasteuri]MDU2401473.1 hypothetical protein [Klebsiella sp.]MDU3556068.1 hypothetical protein [Staphylococcus epidermidis]MDU6091375.1 hypothetical protein [Staphylococcus lugdunensis]HDD4975410.1 hypothetical protein [Staphylococcus aureus]